jgi:hypothetical protein
MSLMHNIAVAWDNIGANDPEVMMTTCIWLAKTSAWLAWLV